MARVDDDGNDIGFDWPKLSSIDKPLVDLGALGPATLGLIILYPSGVVYTNQTGGLLCTHPSAEGVFMPIGTPDQARTLARFFAGASTTIGDAQRRHVDRTLDDNAETRILRVDPAEMDRSHEAWIYVTIASQPGRLVSFGTHGILTWQNSD